MDVDVLLYAIVTVRINKYKCFHTIFFIHMPSQDMRSKDRREDRREKDREEGDQAEEMSRGQKRRGKDR